MYLQNKILKNNIHQKLARGILLKILGNTIKAKAVPFIGIRLISMLLV
jgi:hypothetical protein